MREWLQTPRGDGRPKVLYRNISTSIIGYYTKDFLAATSPANYIVCFEQYFNGYDPQDFEMHNLRPNERLSLRLVEQLRQNKYCMTRRQLGAMSSSGRNGSEKHGARRRSTICSNLGWKTRTSARTFSMIKNN
ncbi:hypothetical protein niasHT_022855 [Heterodera trifolii]|uniref:Uncharacterized protein n=1 Tax=Heterodera trifolii TaxID=157864 RepID=A0ABD2K1W7_9BILA